MIEFAAMAMHSWRGSVRQGRLTLDVQTDLPDGEIDLGFLGEPSVVCDRLFLVVTVTEVEQLRIAATERGLEFGRRESPLGEYFSLGVVGRSRVCAVQTGEGPVGHAGSTAQAVFWKTATGASEVVSIGMAFGLDRTLQQFGDVLVSTHLLPYELRTIKSKHEIPITEYPKVQAIQANRSLLQLVDMEAESERQSKRTFKVHRGALLSGATKVHSRTYRDHLVAALSSRGQPIVGGEMEGVGLLAVAAKPAWLVVKGIVDFADEGRDDEFKKYRDIACKNAAGLVLDAFLHEEENLNA